ncbi:hypothetical protein [Microbulbifer sp. YPW1]|uniref:hypothetical protein n=1 Tax=Microbulbifer sp. YPW1 TaxID=2745199 RepID=UPI00159842A1|nr:hypothetical protein [Microbulbifer sp. YPW1]QKX16601.1 hypothetical protein HUW35_06125 [Microbulbifer sp. YPW1]
MLFWFNLLCIAGLLASLLFILRHKTSLARRIGHGLLQTLIWGLVWALAHPPALLPTAAGGETIRLNSEDGAAALSDLTPAELHRLGTLELDGDGLRRDLLRDMPPVRLHPDQHSQTEAWSLQWPHNLTLGGPLELTITRTQGGAAPIRFTLEDPFGNSVDNATLSAETSQITLRDRPKLVGQWEYRIHIDPETTASGTPPSARSEILPVSVHTTRRPTVLLWLARPGFESAALSRWLRQSGSPTQVVTRLAPDMLRRQTFNDQEPVEGNLLGADSPFDLLILDSRLWPQLSAQDRQRLGAIAEEKSLLWLLHADTGKAFFDYAATVNMQLDESAALEAAYRPPGYSSESEIPSLQVAGVQPAATAATDSRVTAGEHVIYWARTRPRQSLGFVFFLNSYRWQTAGFDSEFSRLWADIFSVQLRWQGGEAPIALQQSLPRENERLTLCSTGFSTESAPAVRASINDASTSSALPAAAAGISAAGNCYNYWPTGSGWYQVGDGDFSFYVFPRQSWAEWQTHLRRKDTAQMAAARLGPVDSSQDTARGDALPRYWIALLLLLLMAGTWLRERGTLR